MATFKLDGYEDKTVQITHRMNTNGVLDIIGFFFFLITPIGFFGQGGFTIDQTTYEATLNPERSDSPDRPERSDPPARAEGSYEIDDIDLSSTLVGRGEDLRVTIEVSSEGDPKNQPAVRCYMLREEDESEIRSEMMFARDLGAGNWEMTTTFSIPDDFKVGEYTIRVKELNSGSKAEKDFRVWE